MADTGAEARNGIGVVAATALAVTIVMGSGVLILPGLAYVEEGPGAFWAWPMCVALCVPLLAVFAGLGRALPGAAGVAGFVRRGFGGHAARGVEVLMIGTFGLGIPGIALTAGGYVVSAAGFPGSGAAGVAAAAVVVASVATNLVGVRGSGRVATLLAGVLVVGLLLLAGLASQAHTPAGSPPPVTLDGFSGGLTAIGLVFFAFTGWELVSFTTGDYRNPERDFPRVVVASLALVTVVYLAAALALQVTLARDTPGLDGDPFGVLAAAVIGGPVARPLVAGVSALLLFANVAGNLWGASRLVMSSSQQGLLPAVLSRGSGTVPRAAVVATGTLFVAVIVASDLGLLPLSRLLEIAGKNFVLLYLLCVLAYLRLFRHPAQRVLGVVALLLLIVPLLTFTLAEAIYAVALFVVGLLLSRWRPVVPPPDAAAVAPEQGAGADRAA